MRSPPPPPPGSEPFLDVALPRARLRTSPRSDAAIAQSLQYEEAQACGLGAPAGDAALAAELQADEYQHAQRAAGATATSAHATVAVAVPSVTDPIWGRFDAAGPRFTCWEVLLMSCAPCVMAPCCGTERLRGWRGLLFSPVWWASCVQVATLIASLCFRGFAPPSVNPLIGPWASELDLLGAKNAALIILRNQWWRLLTPLFLHAGIIHLLCNLILQLRVGLHLERSVFGVKAFAATYLLTGAFAFVASCLAQPNSISVGASGSLMGIISAWGVALVCNWQRGTSEAQEQRKSELITVVISVAATLLFSALPSIDWAAHVSGTVAGVLLGGVAFAGRRMRIVSGTLFVALFAAGLAALLLGVVKPSRELLLFCTYVERPTYPQQISRCFGN